MNIGLFGGSFDPPHMGHVKLACAAIRHNGLDRTYILPAACSPFKEGAVSSDEDRLTLCALSFPASCSVSDYEIAKGGKSYTVETVRHFRDLYPTDRLFWIVGEDQLLIFNTWFRFEEILQTATLCAAVRKGSTKLETLETYADKHLRAFGEVRIMEFEPFEISASEIRRRVSAGEDIHGLVAPTAEEYILEKGLYRAI